MTNSPPPRPALFAARVNANIIAAVAVAGFKWGNVAEDLGTTPQTLAKNRRGERDWTLSEIGQLAALLDIDPADLTAPRS